MWSGIAEPARGANVPSREGWPAPCGNVKLIRLTALLGYRVPGHVVFFIELERRHVWLAGVTTILTAVGSFGRLATWPCPSTMVVAASSSYP
jgi:hypothetical protein